MRHRSQSNPAVAKVKGGSGGGMQGFLDRFRGKANSATPIMSSTRVKVVSVGDDKKEGMKAGLLDNEGGHI